MRNAEDLAVETFDVREIGPYEGQRIAGTSNDVVNAVLTKEYCFADKIAIRVTDIPVRLDRVTGKIYLSGPDGQRLMRLVRHYLELLREQRLAARATALKRAPLQTSIPASTPLAA